jgi:amidase
MMHRIDARNLAYSFDAKNRPVLAISSGDTVVFETVDARAGRAMDPTDEYVVPPPPPLNKLNPVTGPVFVRGARAGDTLLVEVQEIKLGAKGYTIARQDMGVLQEMVKHPGVRVIEIRRGRVVFNTSISFPVRPMIGTIGVAPRSGSVASVNPGQHGGNMDCNDIKVGAKLYLPINVDGAFLALGDVHATMGDGEVSGGGLDVAADVQVKVTVLKDVPVEYPLVESPTDLIVVQSGRKLEDAIKGVVERSVSLIMDKLALSFEDAFRLTSIAGDLRICQACASPLDVVVRMQLPKLFSLR